ncbi:MAG: hypothetical protein LBQ95_05530 [Lachnospiraceae bacterium]|jgi:tetratricopeptide (TPR) repeat protein|nr:hypothetical protein [Lachnospiraceae bacterium]
MANFILCHNKKAKQPYRLPGTKFGITTFEELCYFFYNFPDLVDDAIQSRDLTSWIRNELSLGDLADQLDKIIDEEGDLESFALRILETSHIYQDIELASVMGEFEELKSRNKGEREKLKADRLLAQGEIVAAIAIYQSILAKTYSNDDAPTNTGEIYSHLGAAYGRILLYKEAAQNYKEAYKILKDEGSLVAYLYCLRLVLPEDSYSKELQEKPDYIIGDQLLSAKLKQIKNENIRKTFNLNDTDFEVWKEEYREIDKTRWM